MRAVKRGIETSYLWKCWKISEKRPDRSQIMRLMKRGECHEPLQPGHDAMVDQHRLAEVRTAMNDTMTDCHRANADFVT